jgi:putative ABC transport system substrate-binding protein
MVGSVLGLRTNPMRRRQFITLLGGAAATWPVAAHAQQAERMRRIGVLMNSDADDANGRPRLAAFLQALQQLGWTEGRNVHIDIRWGGLVGSADRFTKHATELIALEPDVILTATTLSTAAVQRATRTIPIVFAMVQDPVGADIVASLSRPGGNTTGFMQFEFSLSGKWLELLKQIAPHVTRAAVFRDPANASGIGQFAVIQAMAPQLGMEVMPVNVRDAAEIERAIMAFASSANGGLIVTGGQASSHREVISELAARHRLPAVYPYRFYVDAGGLISYGPDLPGLFRKAAEYVDRILKGEKPADLPVQAPVKYELVINLKTAKALGLDVPVTVLVRADEVIE